MAKVVGKVSGGSPGNYTVGTVGDLRQQMGLDGKYTATVNGNPQGDSYVLKDEEYVAFAPQAKGGLR